MGSLWVYVRSDASPPYQRVGARREFTRAGEWKKTASRQRLRDRIDGHSRALARTREAFFLSRWLFGCWLFSAVGVLRW